MLKNFIEKLLTEQFEHRPTKSQEAFIQRLADFIVSNDSKEIFLLSGYAGTGKTSLVNALIKTLRQLSIKAVLMAPTGRAAKVLSAYTNKKAYTIHKQIYRQRSAAERFSRFELNFNTYTNTFFIVDEASMIANQALDGAFFGSGRLLDDLIQYVYSSQNCKVMLIGDEAQLPPVRLIKSPALDTGELQTYGLKVATSRLTDVVRQSLESGILYNATTIRNMLNLTDNQVSFPKLKIEGFPDMQRVEGHELIDVLGDAYQHYGQENTIVLCRSNKRANRYNQGIRNAILFREEEISTGDFIMVVKNNYLWVKEYPETDFIANGDIAEILRIKRFDELYGFRFADITLRLMDYNNLEVDAKVMLDVLHLDAPSLGQKANKELFFAVEQDYSDVPQKRQRYNQIREDEFFNALQIKFAYAVTCHKAQGGQWKAVFIDQGYLTDEMMGADYIRWLYTAITRATEKVYLVNFKDDFFEKT